MEIFKSRSETVCLGFEPSQNPVWDLNPHGWDSNPAKTHSTWFQDLMKLRFLISHHRKNSVRDKVIGKKWIYLDTERSTLLQTEGVWTISREWMQPRNLVWLVFIDWVISSAMGGLFQLFLGGGGGFQDLGHWPLLGLLTVAWNCQGTSECVISFAVISSLLCHLGPIWF